MTKICYACKNNKPIMEFPKRKDSKEGFRNKCTLCYKIARNAYYNLNKIRIAEKAVIYGQNNKEKIATKKKEYYKNNREKIDTYKKENLDRIKVKQREYHIKHREENRIYDRNRRQKPEVKQRNAARLRERRRTDIQYKLGCNLRSRIQKALKNKQKKGSAVRDLGCSIEELKQYIEKQFQPGMTWENWNYQGWHIDHKIPLIKFDLTIREEFLKACNYTNLQPMWAMDNFSKHKKLFKED